MLEIKIIAFQEIKKSNNLISPNNKGKTQNKKALRRI